MELGKSKVLLKIGGRKHLGEMRWKAALEIYDYIICICLFKEKQWEIDDNRVFFIELQRHFITCNLLKVIEKTKRIKFLWWVNWAIIFIVRIINPSWTKKIKSIEADHALCCYGDYDFSDLTYLLCKPYLNMEVTRAYKESRPEYNFLEYCSMKSIKRFVFYDERLKYFLERKYGKSFFVGKEVISGLDENVLPESILNSICHENKLSEVDGKVHVALLTFRIDSAPKRSRDQSRYYYLKMIEDLIDAGLVVHLHCAQYNDDHGINRYKLLAEKNPDSFYLESPLDMKHNTSEEKWIESCQVLSRYDAGILHNIVEDSSVSEFDKINVPHRYFAYQAAHVVPLVKKGTNEVLEERFTEMHSGFIYENYADINQVIQKQFVYENRTYEEYLKKVFEGRGV